MDDAAAAAAAAADDDDGIKERWDWLMISSSHGLSNHHDLYFAQFCFLAAE